ncbi:MAG: hypothetical protein HOC71_00425 [Candidatus Latescibacteria bacterium]|jgi:hypothetical protein|nr:hypothetical protein [Candidatus Latescibacterota bacterium]
MIKPMIVIMISFLFINNISAQECGPSCPICSGSTDGSLLSIGSLLVNSISIPGADEENAVFNTRFGIAPRFDVGLGYGVKREKAFWNARFQVIMENERRPGIILGAGSVRIGKSDQSVYLHITKSWEISEMFALRMTSGVANLVPEYDKIYGLGGLTFSIAEKYIPFFSYDGVEFHEGFAWIPLDWLTVSALLVESKDLAFSVGINHSFFKTVQIND